MLVLNIRLTTVGDVEKFVNIVDKAPYDVDLATDRYTVNAKSLMGVYSLDLSQPLKVIMYGDDCSKLCQELKVFETK